MREEWNRQMGSPLFWGLLIGSLLINIWILANFGGQRELVQRSKAAWEQLQLPLNEASVGLYLEALEPMEEKEAGIPTFRQMIEGTLQMQTRLDGESLAEAFSSSLMLEGEAREYVEKEYEKLEEVLEENRGSGAAESFFVPCNRSFFELFSRWLPLFCTLEGMLAGVLLMMKSISEPFATGTAEVVYATKKGRNIQDSKRRAAAAAGQSFCVTC